LASNSLLDFKNLSNINNEKVVGLDLKNETDKTFNESLNESLNSILMNFDLDNNDGLNFSIENKSSNWLLEKALNDNKANGLSSFPQNYTIQPTNNYATCYLNTNSYIDPCQPLLKSYYFYYFL
jgi:hypothetical protein